MTTGRTDWDRINAMTDEEIEANALNDPDALPPTDEMWEQAYVTYPDNPIADLIDAEIVDFFRKTDGPDYQRHMNDILRDYVNRQQNRTA